MPSTIKLSLFLLLLPWREEWPLEMSTNQFAPVRQGGSTGADAPFSGLLWLKQPLTRPVVLVSSTSSTDLPVLARAQSSLLSLLLA